MDIIQKVLLILSKIYMKFYFIYDNRKIHVLFYKTMFYILVFKNINKKTFKLI